jgi:hypothetical protein
MKVTIFEKDATELDSRQQFWYKCLVESNTWDGFHLLFVCSTTSNNETTVGNKQLFVSQSNLQISAIRCGLVCMHVGSSMSCLWREFHTSTSDYLWFEDVFICKRCISFCKIILCDWVRQNSNLLNYQSIRLYIFKATHIIVRMFSPRCESTVESLIFWDKSWK